MWIISFNPQIHVNPQIHHRSHNCGWGIFAQYKMAFIWAFLIAQSVKNLPAIQETRVQFLHREDPLEKEMATRSSILVWEFPWTEEPIRLQVHGVTQNWTWLNDWAHMHLLSTASLMQNSIICVCNENS